MSCSGIPGGTSGAGTRLNQLVRILRRCLEIGSSILLRIHEVKPCTHVSVECSISVGEESQVLRINSISEALPGDATKRRRHASLKILEKGDMLENVSAIKLRFNGGIFNIW